MEKNESGALTLFWDIQGVSRSDFRAGRTTKNVRKCLLETVSKIG
jgi:hypothetical protein